MSDPTVASSCVLLATKRCAMSVPRTSSVYVAPSGSGSINISYPGGGELCWPEGVRLDGSSKLASVVLAVSVLALTACERAAPPMPTCRPPTLVAHFAPETWAGARERANFCIKMAAFETTRAGGAGGRSRALRCGQVRACRKGVRGGPTRARARLSLSTRTDRGGLRPSWPHGGDPSALDRLRPSTGTARNPLGDALACWGLAVRRTHRADIRDTVRVCRRAEIDR